MLFQITGSMNITPEMAEFCDANPNVVHILEAVQYLGKTAVPASAVYAKTEPGVFPDIIEFNRLLCGMVYVGILRMI